VIGWSKGILAEPALFENPAIEKKHLASAIAQPFLTSTDPVDSSGGLRLPWVPDTHIFLPPSVSNHACGYSPHQPKVAAHPLKLQFCLNRTKSATRWRETRLSIHAITEDS
jgi:hypothetical protein